MSGHSIRSLKTENTVDTSIAAGNYRLKEIGLHQPNYYTNVAVLITATTDFISKTSSSPISIRIDIPKTQQYAEVGTAKDQNDHQVYTKP